jgi:predicted DNA binding CopG/RHH family protein
MKKTIPTFRTDAEAEEFVATADLSEFDLSGGQVMRFEMKPKDSSLNLRLPRQLLDAVRGRAKIEGVPYQRFVRMALERALQERK